MNGDIGRVTKAGLDTMLHVRHDLVGGCERQVAVQADMHLDGDAVPDTAGTEIVRLAHFRETVNDVFYLAFGLFLK